MFTHEKNHDFYLQFWSKIFGIPAFQLKNSEAEILSSGFYIEKHGDKYIFFYMDFSTGKKVLAASENNLSELRRNFDVQALSQHDVESLRSEDYFRGLPLAFRDIDYGFSSIEGFKPVSSAGFDIRYIDVDHRQEIEEFYQDCSEDDKDTLDLTFENETALGLYVENKIVAIARYTPLRETQIADITVLVRRTARGKAYSAPLVSKLVERILRNNLVPKYRVEENNHASIAVAKKLGFKPMFRLLAWEKHP